MGNGKETVGTERRESRGPEVAKIFSGKSRVQLPPVLETGGIWDANLGVVFLEGEWNTFSVRMKASCLGGGGNK